MTTLTTGRATDFITFSRTSNATVTGADGRIRWAGHNLLTNSESFDASAWSKANATSTDPVVSANAGVAPNGTTTADRIDFGAIDAAGDYSIVSQIFTAPGAPLTASVWVKALAAGDVGKKIGIYLYDTGIVGVAFVTLTADWQQLTTSGTLSAGGSRSYVIGTLGSAFTGGVNQGAVSVLVWGAHLYRSDLGSMVLNPARGDAYYPTTPRNLLGFTEDFSNAAWSKVGSTVVSANQTVAPNGLNTADLVDEGTGTGYHHCAQSVTTVASNTYTLSFYAKSVSLRWVNVSIYSNGNTTSYGAATFDLLNGVVGTSAASGTGYAIVGSPAITSVGNGWYRCSLTVTNGSSLAAGFFAISPSNVSTIGSYGLNSYTGTGQTFYLWGAQLSDSASLDAYSPVYGAAVTSAAYYAPRLDYDANGSALGLLVEEQRTNLLTYSNDYSDASWNRSNLTITSGFAAPDGTNTAQRIEATSTAATLLNRTSAVAVAATSATFSVYVKKGTGATTANRFILRNVSTSTDLIDLTLNYDTGAITYSTGSPNASATDVGNGWWRLQLNAVSGVTSGNTMQVYIGFVGSSTSAGNHLFAYGAQLEAGSFATSYIPTGSATATRTADVASVSTQAFPYSASEGTLVAKGTFIAPADAGVSVMANLDNGSSGESINIYRQSNLVYLNIFDNSGPAQAQWAVSGTTNLSTAAIAYKLNDIGAAVNGSSQTPDTSATLPTVDRMNIGRMWGGTFGANGWIRQITYIPRRLSASELQARTV